MKNKNLLSLIKLIVLCLTFIISSFIIINQIKDNDYELKYDKLYKEYNNLTKINKVLSETKLEQNYNISYSFENDTTNYLNKESYWYVVIDYKGGIDAYEVFKFKTNRFDLKSVDEQLRRKHKINPSEYLRIENYKRITLEEYIWLKNKYKK